MSRGVKMKKYIAIDPLDIVYEIPKELNKEEIEKLINSPNNLMIYIVCELLGLERKTKEEIIKKGN